MSRVAAEMKLKINNGNSKKMEVEELSSDPQKMPWFIHHCFDKTFLDVRICFHISKYENNLLTAVLNIWNPGWTSTSNYIFAIKKTLVY